MRRIIATFRAKSGPVTLNISMGSTPSRLESFFSLATPRDLLDKLEHDYRRLADAADPVGCEAQYAAFDFFVTAEHLCDWQEHASGMSKKALHAYADGQIVWDIASGAKHFYADPNRGHKTVATTGQGSGGGYFGGFFGGYFGSYFGSQPRLVIELSDGSTVSLLDVAERVLKHWQLTIC